MAVVTVADVVEFVWSFDSDRFQVGVISSEAPWWCKAIRAEIG